MAARPGQPAGSSYGPEDPRSDRERLADLHTIHEQVCTINSRLYDSAVRDDLIRLLQERREEQADDLLQVDPAPDPRGGKVLGVRDELLIRAEALEDHERLIAEYFDRRPVEGLDNRLVRLVARGTGNSRLVQLAGTLRARGVAASMNDVATTAHAVIKKGIGSPEPSVAQRGPSLPPPGDGEPIRVATIDTGIAYEQRSDGWLSGLVQSDNVDPLDELPSPNGYLDLGAGHGTFVAGIIQQVAPGADITVYKAVDSDGVGSTVETASAMVRAVREGAQVLSLSFGHETLDDQPPDAYEIALEIIDEEVEKTGREVLVVAAAGNFGHARPVFPAAFPNVVAVAGLTQGFAPAQWSSRGFWVDCSTLGEGVWSTYVKGRESLSVDPQPDKFGDDAWALWTGTSFAAPQIAGAVAKIAQEEGLAPRDALEKVLDGGARRPGYGRAVKILPPT
jgi:subtilisin family serine protease